MIDPIDLTRCPAPARTEWGTVRCVVRRDRCTHADHRRWDRLRVPMALVWRVRPWWPNVKGRAADKAGRGRALLHEMDRDTTGGAA